MKHYCLKCGEELSEDVLICPKCQSCTYLDSINNSSNFLSGTLSAYQIECNTQWLKYACGPNGRCGHGYAAEDANAMSDMLHGHEVTLSGRDNSLSGPDRITDGVRIQTKYCQSAKQSVMAGFGEDGIYKYEGQVLEVPADQYDEAVSIMEQQIVNGKVKGINNPQKARQIIKKGTVTYRQAKNIAKAGNIDSLIFDAKTQSVVALSSFGISFTINLGLMIIFHCKTKEDYKHAVESAIENGLKNGTISLASGVLASQLAKHLVLSSNGRAVLTILTKSSKKFVNAVYKTKIGQTLVHQIAKAGGGKAIHGAAAQNKVIKLFRSNAITYTAFIIVYSLPDMCRVFSRKISFAQFGKNIFVTICGVGGGAVGVAAGTFGGPVGSFAGGLIGAESAQRAGKWIADKIVKDDAEKLLPYVQIALLQLSHEYMLQNEDEFEHCMRAINSEQAINQDLFYKLNKCPNDFDRVAIAMKELDYYFSVIVRERKKVQLLNNQQPILAYFKRLRRRGLILGISLATTAAIFLGLIVSCFI